MIVIVYWSRILSNVDIVMAFQCTDGAEPEDHQSEQRTLMLEQNVTMDICMKFHVNPFNRDILVWTKAVEQSGGQ